MSEIIRDTEGNIWQACENAYKQRQLRCIEGARKGETIFDPRLGAPPEPRRKVPAPEKMNRFWRRVFDIHD